MQAFLGLRIDDKESSERHAKLSKYGPCLHRRILIKALSILIIDEVSLMQPRFIRTCSYRTKRPPLHWSATFNKVEAIRRPFTVILATNAIQPLPVVPSLKLDVFTSGKARHVLVNLGDEIL